MGAHFTMPEKHFLIPTALFMGASIYAECFPLQCSYINGSPQNTNVPGVIDLAKKHGTFLGGDDFKSGQTKIKSVLVDFLVSAGLKVCNFIASIVMLFFLSSH